MSQQESVSRRGVATMISGASLLGLGALASAADAAAATGAIGKARERKLSAEDRLDIIELMARYAWAYDTSDAEGLAATFTPDGILEVFGKPLVQQPSDFGAFLRMAADMRKEKGWQHLTDHHVFTGYDGKSCIVYSYYVMPESDPTGGAVNLRAMGYYVSHCVRGAQGWLFAKREVLRWTGKRPF